ncbi:TetR/AcrR family transcriptional regulator [Planococcus sp. CAU13]|uniref:TetR/AcrR family transcriptional regulator n=1 Tax=Planococcus sp. CAU13 TaxID=1541197 RepID=UPI00052FDC1E|nr:TetR/AcrR family transcriptional regulator [Planococcus sp. CAU13]
MSKQSIKQAAINQFHRYGYEGVKMAQVAAEAGMRKQSISYHYPSKRDLFTELYNEVIEEEMKFLQAYFNGQPDLTAKELLYRFLKEMKRRTSEDVTVVFLHLMSYSPPSEIDTFVASRYLTNFNVFKDEVRKVFEKEAFTSGTEECTLGYVTLFDGLLVHLFYNTGLSYEHSLDVSFEIFWKGISCTK